MNSRGTSNFLEFCKNEIIVHFSKINFIWLIIQGDAVTFQFDGLC